MRHEHKLIVALAALCVAGASNAADTNRQRDVAQRGAQVMPFDLEQTTHLFRRLKDGGLERVTANDPKNHEQIALIRQHLEQEAERFGRGDFSDPARIHGSDMPGLAELAQGASRMTVRYRELADGAEIRFATNDPQLIEAIRRWMQAQLADHGKHAVPHAR